MKKQLFLATIALFSFPGVIGELSNRNLRTRIGGDGRGGSAGARKSTTTATKRTLPPLAAPTVSPVPSSSPTVSPVPLRFPTVSPDPSSSPTVSPGPSSYPSSVSLSTSCNICSVPGATVSQGQNPIFFQGTEFSCSELETFGLEGSIQSDEDCKTAQDTALLSCGCKITSRLGVRETPICSDEALNEDDLKWLEAHNERREFWHAFYDVDFEPLCWDSNLAFQAQFYADYLAQNCLLGHDTSKTDPQGYDYCRRAGENLAFDSSSIPYHRTPMEVTMAWTDKEYHSSSPGDGHFTQVLWRGTKYLGCAEAFNSNCQWKNIQVCRYVRYGNCNCNSDGCREAMLEDASICGPAEVDQTLEEYTGCFNDWYGR